MNVETTSKRKSSCLLVALAKVAENLVVVPNALDAPLVAEDIK